MYQDKKAVLIFGVGPLQQSIVGRAKKMGLFTVGIDPCEDATCRNDVDAFEVVGGQDYEGTCAVVEKYGIDAIVTAATDKPLVMMSRIAEKFGFPFFSVETAKWSTDKFQMKQRFLEGGVPCAKGRLVKSIDETADMVYPVIVKPRDNSGSRGVKLCRTKDELKQSMAEALEYSKLDSVLVEEFIEGQEYSIEGLHYAGKSEVIQYTEKKTTEFPYNVELGHIQPADISEENKLKIREIVAKIGTALKFENCPSHTELKINERGIFVIETSPRLGGDYITSTLVPLSTGINMEDQLIHIALGETVDTKTGRVEKASGVCFLNLPCGKVKAIDSAIEGVNSWPNVYSFSTSLKVGDEIYPITSSLNRYGQLIAQGENKEELDTLITEYESRIYSIVSIHCLARRSRNTGGSCN
jgi:carbamoyl-phosphate synthase large subunit